MEWKEEKGVRDDAKEEKKAESKVDVGMSDRTEGVWTLDLYRDLESNKD